MRSNATPEFAAAGLTLTTLSADEYVRDVLPSSAALWAGSRTYEEYVAEFRTTAASAWGRRRFRTLGLHIDGRLVASCKRYSRVLRCGDRTYDAAGIGAVFTPEDLRGRGYATAMLAAFLDAELASGTDLAYLFSDIRPSFYQTLGFVKVPSRAFTLRADALTTERARLVALNDGDAAAIRRVFDALDARRPFAFARTPLDWEWQRQQATSHEHAGQPLTLGVRRGRSLAAYVTGRRIPAADAFVLDEFAFAREGDAHTISPLLRAAAGDLRKIQGWLPPAIARAALPRGAVRARTDAIAMLVPLSAQFRRAWSHAANATTRSEADPTWSTDHI